MPLSSLKFGRKLRKMFHSRLATQLRSNLYCSKNKQDIVAKIGFFFWPIKSCTMPSAHDPPLPLLGEPKFIEIGFSSHSVTIFELPKHEDRYATCSNKSAMKQDIHEMIPILNKVIPLRSISFKYTVALYQRHSNASSKAQTWQIVQR